jgi:hypothetical protein
VLIVSGTSREENRKELARQLGQSRIPVRLLIQKSRLTLQSVLWREYWQPCGAFFKGDLRLVQRLNRFKKAWLNMLRHPAEQHQAQFGLPGTAAVFCTGDGFCTEANYFVVTSPDYARHVRGERLW